MADKPSQLPRVSSQQELRIETSFSGPLPHPGFLAAYEQVCPGAAARIIKMTEDQGEHRRALESRMWRDQTIEAIAGLLCGFMISLAFIAAAVYTSIHGQPWVGGVLGSLGLTGLVTAFINGKPHQETPPQRKKSQKR